MDTLRYNAAGINLLLAGTYFVLIETLKSSAPTKLALLVATALLLQISFCDSASASTAAMATSVPATAPTPTENPESATIYSVGSKKDTSAEKPTPEKLASVIPPRAAETLASPANTTEGAGTVYEQDEDSKMLAQAVAQSTSTQPTDLAPVRLPERTSAMGQFEEFKTSALYKLPSRMFLSATVENSIRLETNVFQTLKNNRADFIYRILPNATIGYALTKRTRVAGNYFFFRDQYTINSNTLSRNIHSLGGRIDHDIPINAKTSATVSFFARQLLLSRTQPLSDLLPSASIVRRVGDRGAIYASILGQVRFRNVLKKYQEFDQFYSLGGVYRTPRWTFLADHTFITNFGNRRLRQGPDNALWVLTYEAAYKISPVIPVAAFVRAEPIFNIGANQATGFAGFNCRIFGGLRFEVAKPPIFPVKIKRS